MKDYIMEGYYVVVGLDKKPIIETVSKLRDASINLFRKHKQTADWKVCEHNGYRVVHVDISFTENNNIY